MHQPNQPFPRIRAGVVLALILCGAITVFRAPLAFSFDAGTFARQRQTLLEKGALSSSSSVIAQNDSDDEDSEVPTSQVDKYINVYTAMQKDHTLTVEQAASKEGFTVDQFRDLENKIENDDTLRERVRKALRRAANPKAADAQEQ